MTSQTSHTEFMSRQFRNSNAGNRRPADKWERDLNIFKQKYSNAPIADAPGRGSYEYEGSGLTKKMTRKNYQSIYGGAPFEDPNQFHSHIKGGFGHERDNTFKSRKQQLDESGGYRWESLPDEDETTLAGGPIIEYANQWILANIRVPPQFEFRSVVDGDMDTKKHNFECVMSVPGFPYAAKKKSGSKNQARLMACVDFIQYLVNNNHIDQDDLPDFFKKKKLEGKDMPGFRDIARAERDSSKPRYRDKSVTGTAADRRDHAGGSGGGVGGKPKRVRQDAKYGWDKRSARFRLHKFCRENGIVADIKVVAHGSEYQIINEAHIEFRYSGKLYTANVKNRNKKWAQNIASLEIVNALCEDGHVEKCENLKKWHALQEGSEKRMWQKVDHGGWSLETARPRFYRFLKDNKIYQNLIFTAFGNPPVERHIAEITFKVKIKAGKDDDMEEDVLEINGRGEAPTKDLAERRCCLHTLMQLHKLKLVNKEAEDKEAERAVALGTVESVKLGVDAVAAVKRDYTFTVEGSLFYKMAPCNMYKRQRKTDLFSCSFDAMKDDAKKHAYTPLAGENEETHHKLTKKAKMEQQVKDMTSVHQHLSYLEPDPEWLKFRDETLDDLDAAFAKIKAKDANLISFQDVDVTPFDITVKDEFICTRVLASQKRPTRDLLERMARMIPDELVKVMKRHGVKAKTQTDMAPKECAIRMNIVRPKFASPEDTKKVTDIMGNEVDIEAEQKLKADAEVYNDETQDVLYLEIIFTSPECTTKLLESTGIDSMAPEKAVGIGPAVSRFAVLPLLPSLAANRSLRRKTWYEHEVKKDKKLRRDFSACVTLFRDLSYRWPNWQPLENWHIFQIVYIALKGIKWQIYDYQNHLMLTDKKRGFTIADCFRRCLELLASGYILGNGCGIIDPCETGDVDVFADMTLEMRNIVTLASQTALRCMNSSKLDVYLSDPEALMKPDAAKFGYGNEEEFEEAMNQQMERDIAAFQGEATGFAQPRVEDQVEEATEVDQLVGGERKDDVDDAIDDFMKELS